MYEEKPQAGEQCMYRPPNTGNRHHFLHFSVKCFTRTMKCKDCVKVIFLCSLLIITYKASSECEYEGLEGDSVTLELRKKHDNIHDIKWVHASTVVFRKKGSKTQQSKGFSLSNSGSLTINSAKQENTGQYSVVAYNTDGQSLFQDTHGLCIYDKVQKPTLNFTCTKGKVKLKCTPQNKGNINIVWRKDGTQLSSSVQELIEKENGKYECTVSNPVHKNTSEIITTCAGEEEKLFGFDLWIMVAILAGGGALVVLLIIVLIACACQSCKRREKQQRDQEEFSLSYLCGPPSYDEQRSKQTAKGQPAPPIPLDEANGSTNEMAPALPQTQPKTRGPARGRPPPPPIEEDEEPPPLPQVRKKAPRAKKREAPMYMQP